jgi:hypothetical protein
MIAGKMPSLWCAFAGFFAAVDGLSPNRNLRGCLRPSIGTQLTDGSASGFAVTVKAWLNYLSCRICS